MKKLNNWKMVDDQDPFMAPEIRRQYLNGEIFGHPDHDDGTVVTTSSIASVNGRIVKTHSGSEYELGDPDTKYLQWCKDNGHHIPLGESPIKDER